MARLKKPEFEFISPDTLLVQINKNLLGPGLETEDLEKIAQAVVNGAEFSTGIHPIAAGERIMTARFTADPPSPALKEEIELFSIDSEERRETLNSDLTYTVRTGTPCGRISATRAEDYSERASDVTEELSLKISRLLKVKHERTYLYLPPCRITYRIRIYEADALGPPTQSLTGTARKIIETLNYEPTRFYAWTSAYRMMRSALNLGPAVFTGQNLSKVFPQAYFLKPGAEIPAGMHYREVSGERKERLPWL